VQTSRSHCFGGRLLLCPKYEVAITIKYCIMAIANIACTLYVTSTFDVLTLESCYMIPLVWLTPLPSLKWMWLIFPQRYTERQLSPNFYIFWKGDIIWIYFTLLYKTAVYTLVNGIITHQKQQISKKVILCSTLPKCQCTAEQYHIFWYLLFLMCNDAVN